MRSCSLSKTMTIRKPGYRLAAFQNPVLDNYRLVLADPSTRRIWARRSELLWHLPRISVPRWMRAAEQIQAGIRDTWGSKAIILDILESQSEHGPLAIAELRDRAGMDLQDAFRWACLSEISEHEFSTSERSILESLINLGATGRGRFSRFGWCDEALDWLSVNTGIEISGVSDEIKQFNIAEDTMLLRFGRTTACPLWFKASARSRTSEYRTTIMLSKLLPRYLPKLVAAHEDWNAWWTEDAGRSLEDSRTSESSTNAVARLAELQKESIYSTSTLLASRCEDRRTPVLCSRIPQIIDSLGDAMAQQQSSYNLKLSPSRIRELGSILEDACMHLNALGIPDSVLHGDIRLGNILDGPRGCVFTDWANTAIGNPFITFEQLRAQIAQEDGQEMSQSATETYRKHWAEVLTTSQIDSALAHARPVALMCYLMDYWEWIVSDRQRNSQFQRYLRGMARQLDRAAHGLEGKDLQCA